MSLSADLEGPEKREIVVVKADALRQLTLAGGNRTQESSSSKSRFQQKLVSLCHLALRRRVMHVRLDG